jgi:hypothetical protein
LFIRGRIPGPPYSIPFISLHDFTLPEVQIFLKLLLKHLAFFQLSFLPGPPFNFDFRTLVVISLAPRACALKRFCA